MTIRGRLTLTQTMIAVVVVALCALVIDLARTASELSRMPAQHMSALGHIHDLYDSVGQAVKDLDDVTKGEDDAEELAAQMDRAHIALEAIRRDADDPHALALVVGLDIVFSDFKRGQARVLARADVGDFEGAREIVFPLGEELYERHFRPALGRLESHAIADVEALGDEGRANARDSMVIATLLVLAGVLGTALATVIVLRIQRRLSALATAATQIGGDIRHARSRDVTARDELGDLGRSFNRMADDVATLIDMTAAKEALASELALAARMQQSLLPPAPLVPGLEIAGAMSTVTQVGGDYYDVLPARDGAWIAIGDVSGHGFNTGVVTLLAQSAIASVTGSRPDAGPAEILQIVNDVLHELVRVRLGLRDHMTLTLLRYHDDGSVEFAGAHEEIIVRAADGTPRTIDTTGPWLAVVPDIRTDLVERRFQLAEGETIVLFTDGVVEARIEAGDMFGLERLIDAVTALPGEASARAIRDTVFARVHAAAPKLEDDATVLAIRRIAAPPAVRAAS
jgi:HAMP domain-containing protein